MSTLAARVRRLPLRVRLTLAGTLLLPLPLAIVFGLVFLRFESALNATIDGDLRARANAVAVMLGRQGPTALHGGAAEGLLRPLGAFAQVGDRNGRVLSSTDAVAHVRLLTPAQAARAAAQGLVLEHRRIPYVAKRSRLVAEPLEGGRSALVVGRSLKDREGANESFGRALLIGGPLPLLLAAAACYLASAGAPRALGSLRPARAAVVGGGLLPRVRWRPAARRIHAPPRGPDHRQHAIDPAAGARDQRRSRAPRPDPQRHDRPPGARARAPARAHAERQP